MKTIIKIKKPSTHQVVWTPNVFRKWLDKHTQLLKAVRASSHWWPLLQLFPLHLTRLSRSPKWRVSHKLRQKDQQIDPQAGDSGANAALTTTVVARSRPLVKAITARVSLTPNTTQILPVASCSPTKLQTKAIYSIKKSRNKVIQIYSKLLMEQLMLKILQAWCLNGGKILSLNGNKV